MPNNFIEKSKISRNKKLLSALALLLMFTMALPLAAMQIASAHLPPWDSTSYAYIVVAPNPVGVNQKVSVTIWVDTPLPGAVVGNDIRRHDYKVNIMRPDGKNDTKTFAVVQDTTGLQFFQYIPTLVGTYTFEFIYPKQTFTWVSGQYQNDTYQAANRVTTLTVTEAQLPAAKDSYPIPSEYWTYPIEGQNTYMFSASSNFLGQPYISGAGAAYGIPGNIQPDGPAPNSAHVMWSKPIQFGGVVPGSVTGIQGEMFYTGGSYNVRYSNPLIMYGTLFYAEPYGNGGGGGAYVAVDLRTGQEKWRINTTATGTNLVPSFGYLYAYDSPNQHGILPNGLLIATSGSTWRGYDPRTGVLTAMNLTSVPSGGATMAGPSGEYLRLILTNYGTSSNPNWYLMQWNSSNVFGGGSGLSPANWYSGGGVPANCPITPGPPNSTNTNWNGSMWIPSANRTAQGYVAVTTPAYDWNVSVSLAGTGWAISNDLNTVFKYVKLDKMALFTQGSFGGRIGDYSAITTTLGANLTAISLDPKSRGATIFTQYYPTAPGNNTRSIDGWDVDAGIFVFWDKESMTRYGYSLADGSYVWGPTATPTDTTWDFNYLPATDMFAYGKFFVCGYNGILYAYDVKTGNKLWSYGNGGVGNSTSSGLNTPWGHYPIFIDVIADGKIYISTAEHSPNSPLYKDALFRAIDAETGKEVWTLMGYATNMYGGTDAIADGYLAFANMYDMQIYSVGRGPSATTVSIQNDVVTQGSTVLIKGTVTDISAGTQQDEQAARFPHGVPAVSDADMGKWMEYVYMQKPRPVNVTGVKVVLTITGPDGTNYGAEATSDDQGNYATIWFAPTPGTYKVTANFPGTASYYPSSGGTYFAAIAAAAPVVVPTATPVTPTSTITPPPTTAPTQTPSPEQPTPLPKAGLPTEAYIAIASVIIIAIVAAIALALRRRK